MLSLKHLLYTIVNFLLQWSDTNIFLVQRQFINTMVSTAEDGNRNYIFTIPNERNTGYTCVGLVGFAWLNSGTWTDPSGVAYSGTGGTQNTKINPTAFYYYNSTQIMARVHNEGTASKTCCEVDFLFIKSKLVSDLSNGVIKC